MKKFWAPPCAFRPAQPEPLADGGNELFSTMAATMRDTAGIPIAMSGNAVGSLEHRRLDHACSLSDLARPWRRARLITVVPGDPPNGNTDAQPLLRRVAPARPARSIRRAENARVDWPSGAFIWSANASSRGTAIAIPMRARRVARFFWRRGRRP